MLLNGWHAHKPITWTRFLKTWIWVESAQENVYFCFLQQQRNGYTWISRRKHEKGRKGERRLKAEKNDSQSNRWAFRIENSHRPPDTPKSATIQTKQKEGHAVPLETWHPDHPRAFGLSVLWSSNIPSSKNKLPFSKKSRITGPGRAQNGRHPWNAPMRGKVTVPRRTRSDEATDELKPSKLSWYWENNY